VIKVHDDQQSSVVKTSNCISSRPAVEKKDDFKFITSSSPISDSFFNAAKEKNIFSSTDEWEFICASAIPSSSLYSATLNSSSTISASERIARPSQWAHLSSDL
jgi:hypothetical protein